MDSNERKLKLVAKPIESTPVLKGKDLVDFVNSLSKTDSSKSLERRKSALSMVKKIRRK